MGKINTILKELKEIAPSIAVLDNQNPYQIPDFYFDSFAAEVLKKIHSHVIKELQNPYQSPAGYFDGLAESIIQKIHSKDILGANNEVYRELLEIAPLLNSLNKENIFSVPENYFENLRVPRVIEKGSARIIPMGSRIRKWVTYAAAASILFIFSTSAYLYANKHIRGIDKSPSIEQKIADLNEDDIISYLNDNQESPSDYIPASDAQESKIHDMLEKVSDEDIKSFLDDYSGPDKKTIKGI